MEKLHENFARYQPGDEVTYDELLSLRCNYIVTRDTEFHLYLVQDCYRRFLEEGAGSVPLCSIPEQTFEILYDSSPFDYTWESSDYVLVLDDSADVIGIFDSPEFFDRLGSKTRYMLDNLKRREDNFRRICNVLEDEVFVTDEYGFIQYINPRGEYIMGIHAKDWIGHHVSEMINRNVLPDSLSLKVIDCGERCMEIVDLPTGIRIICSAQPIYDENGKVVQILSTSKNIDEITDKISDLSKELQTSNEQIRRLQEQVLGKQKYIFESPPMKHIQKMLMKVAPADVTVLIQGESGVGKEVIADSVYRLSRRKDKPFVKINCGLIPKDLMESEFFGYEAGAFTGASKNGKIGKLEVANGGTVFLDEIGEMELPLQVKFLEFLQDHQIVRLGGTRRIPIDIRVVAATNRDLYAMVEEGTFRRDLYYRLNVMPLYIPPLRERREDIVPLLYHFLNIYNKKYSCDKHLGNNVVEQMQNYKWPGNVRELCHAVERIVVVSDNNYIDSIAFEDLQREGMTMANMTHEASGKVFCTELMPLKDAKHELERYLVRKAYEQFGSSYKAAEFLKVNQSTVSRWLNRK